MCAPLGSITSYSELGWNWDGDGEKPSASVLEDRFCDDDEEDLETCKSHHIPLLCVCLWEGAQAGTHMLTTSPPPVCLVWPTHVSPLGACPQQWASELLTNSQFCASCLVLSGNGSWTERHLLPTAAKPGWGEGQGSGGLFLQQRSIRSHDPHAQSAKLRVFPSWVTMLLLCPLFSHIWSRLGLQSCAQSRWRAQVCVPLCKQLLDLIMLFYESR